MKKFASLVLTALMLTTMLSVFALPASAAAQTIDGTDITWELSEDGKTLTFTGKGAMPDYDIATFEGRPWANAAETVTTVQINPGITTLGDYAFCLFEKMTSVTIPDGVTSIGEFAFDHCESLTSVTIPVGVTSIGDFAFNSCSNLTSVTIPVGVTSIGMSAFNCCTSLTSVTIPASVTSIGMSAFMECSSLTSVTIPASVTSIGNYAFDSCERLTSVTIPVGVTSIGDGTFRNCTSLQSVTIPYGVTSIGYSAFANCDSLTSVTIPASVTSIGWDAFLDCSNLTSVTVKASTPPTLEDDSVFDNTPEPVIYVPYGTSDDYISADNWESAKISEKIREAYIVDTKRTESGTVTVDIDSFSVSDFAEGQTVTVSVVPNEGYRLKADSLLVTYKDENGTEKTADLTQDETDPMKYTFTMPCSNVTVTAEFEKIADESEPAPTATVFSEGNIWIIIAVAAVVIGLGGAAALFIVKKKKKAAASDGESNK